MEAANTRVEWLVRLKHSFSIQFIDPGFCSNSGTIPSQNDSNTGMNHINQSNSCNSTLVWYQTFLPVQQSGGQVPQCFFVLKKGVYNTQYTKHSVEFHVISGRDIHPFFSGVTDPTCIWIPSTNLCGSLVSKSDRCHFHWFTIYSNVPFNQIFKECFLIISWYV